MAQALATYLEQQQPSSQQLIIDCGATHHMFNNLKLFSSSLKPTSIQVATGDVNSNLTAVGIGTVKIISNNKILTVEKCLYVPGLKCMLISLLQLFKEELTVNRRDNTFNLMSQGKEILRGKIINKLMISTYSIPTSLFTSSDKTPWHDRLGHPGPAVLKLLGIEADKNNCLICEANKSHRQALNTLDCVHMDIDIEERNNEALPTQQPRIKIIGLQNPMLIDLAVNNINILPYKRRRNALLTTVNEAPNMYSKAIKSKYNSLWQQAINNELTNMEALKGFTQSPGIDFDKTYAPTGRLNSLRTLIAFACTNNLQFHQIDVKYAFLNTPLKETVYLAIPQGLNLEKQKYCLRLNKAMNGLWHAPVAWYKRLKSWLTKVNVSACVLDPCVFHRPGKYPTWLYVHVDNITSFGNNTEDFKKEIGKEFEIKDIGPADLMLGVKIHQMGDGISLNQQHFTEALLEQYGMNACKMVVTPLTPNEHLCPATTEEVESFINLKTNYRSAIGSINYLISET
ncbi:hypothetical protein O181_017097 [Austropuccinia psidii MF-1]|uniref:Reverse transcriptase Ty1/copia-type domain-containing protein n=1 Tax=Austropuccinia psidii MF-1 TaxID=1389203 RepID=A0A9Q3C593_9BASI|nr:hypothetical protein [Austropuccinia psidii MF-1]